MHYNNSAYQVLVGVQIGLFQGNTQIGSTSTTDANGYYHFDDVCCDDYVLRIIYNPYAVGSINSTDACQVQWWWTHCAAQNIPIQLVNFFAGDVDWSSGQDWINSTDAMLIQQYFVYGGAPTINFDRAPWSYAIEGMMQACNGNPPILTDDILVNLCSDQDINLLAQVTGDFNRSYIVGWTKDASAKVQLTYGKTKQVSPNKETDLQIYVVNPTKVSAASLVLNFPANLVEVTNVTMAGGQLDWTVKGNELRIGWHTMNPLNLDAHGELVTLHLRTTSDFKVGSSIRLALVANPLNELADQMAVTIPNAVLGVDVIEASPVVTPDNSSVSDLTFENHPNPFSYETSFDYSLPFDGKVTIVIHNLLGVVVKTLVNEPQAQGDHTFRFDASSLACGVYTATIKLDANGTTLVRTIKIVRSK
jgi:hypothetical protein